jgi:hypothetical protein
MLLYKLTAEMLFNKLAFEAVPESVAVIVPALKLPDASRATMVLPVLAFVAFDVTVKVAAPDPLYVVDPDSPVPDVPKVNVFRLEPNDIPDIVPLTHDGAAAPFDLSTCPEVPAAS